MNFGVRTAGDWGYLLASASNTLRRHYFSIWLSDNQFGRVLIDAGQAPTYAAYGWLSYYLHFNYALNERLIHLWPAVIIALISSYFLVKYIYNDKFAAILGMIVYSANTYYLALLTGGLTLVVAYALAPSVILFYIKAVKTGHLVNMLICGLLLSICGAYEPRVAFIVIAILALYAVIDYIFIMESDEQRSWRSILDAIKIYSIPVVIFAVLNLYWILGLSKAGGADSSVIASNLFGNEFFNAQVAFTLFHPFWTGSAIQPFFLHNIPSYFWLIPLLAIGGIILNKKRPVILYFALIGMIGILLTKQSGQPFPNLYQWLFTHLPGFNAFRESSKFYLMIALSYSVLLPAVYIYFKNKFNNNVVTTAAFSVIALLFLPNLIPIASSKIGATFSSRSIPRQYDQLNKALDEDSYSRILWVPQKTRWGLVNSTHPTVSASTLLTSLTTALDDDFEDNNNATVTDEISNMLKKDYMSSILSSGSIKYVVVPMRDIANDDNFYRSYNDDPTMFARTLSQLNYLKPSSIKVDGFKVYETRVQPNSYFSGGDKLYSLTGGKELSSNYSLWQKSTNKSQGFNFSLDKDPKEYSTEIRDLFGDFNLEGLKSSKIFAAKINKSKANEFYLDREYRQVGYTATPTSIKFQTQTLPSPDKPNIQKPIATQTYPIDKSKKYIVATGNHIEHIETNGKPVNLGSPENDTQIFSIDTPNLISKNRSDVATLQSKLHSCIAYGVKPATIFAKNEKDSITDKSVLSLIAKDHAACSGPDEIAVRPGSYLLSFKYRGSYAQFAGYQLKHNAPGAPIIVEDIPVADGRWHNYNKIITIPAKANKATVTLLTRPSNQLYNDASVAYADLSFGTLSDIVEADTSTNKIEKVDVTSATVKDFVYKPTSNSNLIYNGQFQQGLWQTKVGDCNAYDSNAQIKMNLVKDPIFTNSNALQLAAKRHIACTNTRQIDIEGGSTYLLRYDYQSPTKTTAGYEVSLDDRNNTIVSAKVPIKDTESHTYTQVFTVPPDASQLSLAFFAYSRDDSTGYSVNNYGNVVLRKVPDLGHRFFSIATPTTPLMPPKNITYSDIGTTQKNVSLTGASEPFILLMSEQYHPGWKLMYGNKLGVKAYLPLSKVPSVPDSNHLNVNGFQNAWYINPKTICNNHKDICKKNSDGTLNIQLSAQFDAQRWFNFGLLLSGISAITLVTTIALLIYPKRKKKAYERNI